jgi:hypothetical protein
MYIKYQVKIWNDQKAEEKNKVNVNKDDGRKVENFGIKREWGPREPT